MKTPYFIEKIDWSELRNQKSTLIGLMNTCTTVEEAQTLEGLLNLIDALQDYAVDEMDIDPMHVFDFNEEDVRDGYVGIEPTMSEEKMIVLCSNCNSDNVELRHWINPNTNETDISIGEEEDTWCNDCETHGCVYASKLIPDAEVIGYQVVGGEDCELHPDVDTTFSLYNLSQAREIINNSDDTHWRLLTIWTGDVEEPTTMYSGSPRD